MKPKAHVAVIQKRESIEESYRTQLLQITSQKVALWAMLSLSRKRCQFGTLRVDHNFYN